MRNVLVYIDKTFIFYFNQNNNILIQHRLLLTQKYYFFEFIIKIEFVTKKLITIIRVVISDN